MKRDPVPSPAEVAIATAEIMTAARRATAPGADPVTAVASIRDALAPLWPNVPPEAVRDVLVVSGTAAYDHGLRGLPDGLDDQTAGWLMEMIVDCRTGRLASPGPGGMSPPVAFASSVAFDRSEDAETFETLAVVLALAETAAAPDPGPVSPSPWGHPEPAREDDPDEPINRDIEPDPEGWHDGPDPVAEPGQ